VDRTIFDRYVRDRVTDLDRIEECPPGSEVRKQRLEGLARLRRKLGHAPAPPPAPLVSSRDLLPGVRVTIRPDALSTGNPPAGRLVVAWVDEEAIELGPLDGDPAEKAFYEAVGSGRGCWAVFGRPGEATYRFRSRILGRPGVELPSLVLGHGDFLVKEERRRTPRVVHKFPVTVRVQDADRVLQAETVDVSWGGVGLLLPEPIARGSILAFELPLNSPADAIPVTAKVVGSSAQEAGRGHVLNTQFATVAPAARTQLQVFLGAAHRQLKAQAVAPVAAI
jgi:c-di-GMP-binding flagellar brake protein YcgR